MVERRPQQCTTLGEAASDGFSILISCKACKFQRVVETAPLQALFVARRWERNLIAVSNRMKCQKCGQKWCSVDAVAAKPDSPPIGPKDDAEYQALVRLMRD